MPLSFARLTQLTLSKVGGEELLAGHRTPTGTRLPHCFVAKITGGAVVEDGPEGPARSHPLKALPAIMPIRVANQRALHTYLAQREP